MRPPRESSGYETQVIVITDSSTSGNVEHVLWSTTPKTPAEWTRLLQENDSLWLSIENDSENYSAAERFAYESGVIALFVLNHPECSEVLFAEYPI